ncbi:MAG: RsmE family RNA methyltransferase [Candidatus Omnitrophica bacterium]|jgi:16S rRNA (uracil1498-N3)-methyltransferase|nr:RsmE family RNA methyltransferase [Candidatus Omnitrophota bacterium]MDD5661134.1 RsmE family RNA methyltransferase [Candidatus Omnitrophota bacterium]
MNRFFVEHIQISENLIFLDDPKQLHHLRDVLRVRPSEKIGIFDNSGNDYIVLVKEIGLSSAKLELMEKRMHDQPGLKITIACAIPKNAKMDDIIDKLTQLGVECIIPLETERVIVKLSRQKKIERLERWNKIALSAAKQSQRSRLPVIKAVSGLKEIIARAGDFPLKLIPTLEGERKTLKALIHSAPKDINSIMVLIGPEGDFSPEEIVLSKSAGFQPVSLGRQVLRVDTAAIAVVSFIKLNEPCAL